MCKRRQDIREAARITGVTGTGARWPGFRALPWTRQPGHAEMGARWHGSSRARRHPRL